jgi:hypothetical protein
MTTTERTVPEVLAKRSQRGRFIKWLRSVHGWVGLWGAVLGLLFGTTGFLLNHRGGPLRISTGHPQVATVQVKLPDPAPDSPHALAQWLRGEYHLTGRLGRVQRDEEQPVAWGAQDVTQPEHWRISFAAPHENVSADYWAGNGFVTLTRTDNALLATLANLHKGVGLGVGWVLLIDTLAGSLILLSLTGVLLWTELRRNKTLAVVLIGGSVVALVWAGLA